MDFNSVSYILNGIGMSSSLLCLVLFAFIASRNIIYVNRITFKLQAAMSLADFLFHLFVILSWDGTPGKLCSFYAFAKMFSISTYYCIVFVITLILHINVLSARKIKKSYIKYFWIAIVVIPILHTVPLYALGMFGLSKKLQCFIDDSQPGSKIVVFTNLIIPILIVFLYCFVIALLIFIKAIKSDKIVQDMIEVHNIQNDESKILLKKSLNNWILRIMFYPLAFCLTQSDRIADFLFRIISGHHNIKFYYWAISGVFLSGFVNLIAFLCDPYFQSAIKFIFSCFLESFNCFIKTLNSPGEIPSYEMEARSLPSKGSGASNLPNTLRIRHRYYSQDQQETDYLLREITKDL